MLTWEIPDEDFDLLSNLPTQTRCVKIQTGGSPMAHHHVKAFSCPSLLIVTLDKIYPALLRMVAGAFLVSPTGPYKTLADLWDE